MTASRKKLIEVALPLDAINRASAREKSIRHGHPSTLHLWWARRPAERGFVGELRGHRNRWAHQESFSSDDAYRVLDLVGRLLASVSAPQSDELEKLKMELLRVRFDEQSRGFGAFVAGHGMSCRAATMAMRGPMMRTMPAPWIQSAR